DGSRSRQSHQRKRTRRSDLSARRGKEGAESSQSNRPGAAHSEYTPSGRCSVTGRAQDGTSASRHENFHGVADGSERRKRSIGPFTPNRTGAVEERGAHGGHQLHVHRRPQGQGKIQGAGPGRVWHRADETSAPTKRGRGGAQRGVAQRQAAGV